MANYLGKPLAAPTGYIAGMQAGMDVSNANEARKVSSTEQALKSLEAVSSRLDALVSELERRLSPVLLATIPSNPNGEQRGSTSPLADKVFNEESTLRGIADRIDSIISRVDL